MTRYTIPGETNDRARADRRRGRLTLDEAWAIILTSDRLHGIGASMHPRPVHRERVRFGAWEEAPTSGVTFLGQERAIALLFEGDRAGYEAAARHVLTAFGPYAGRWDVSDYEVLRLARTFAHLDWASGTR